MRLDYSRLVHYIYHHYISIILVALAASVVTGFYAKQLDLKTNFADLLPQDYISVKELNRIKARVGGIGPMLVIIQGETLEKSIDFMLVLADSLENNPLISSVSRGKDRERLNRYRLLYMDLEDLEEIYQRLDAYVEEEKLKQSPLYIPLEENILEFSDIEAKYSKYQSSGIEKEYYLTKEKTGVILTLYPAGIITDPEFSAKMLASLDATIADIDPDINYTTKGSFKTTAQQYDMVMQDLKSTALFGILGVLVLISFYFRQVLAAIFIALPLLMSISWTFGITYLVIGNLNQITIGLFAIIFGLGIDFGVHIFARYREARRRGLNVEAALDETVCHTGSALTTTAVTTSVAFFSLLMTDFKGFSEFGFIVGSGILFALIAMLIVCPAFITMAERLKMIRLRKKNVPDHLLKRGRYPKPYLTLGLGLIVTAYSLYHIQEIEFEYDFHKLKPQTEPLDDKASLPNSLKERRSPAIILTESRQQAEAVVAAVEKIKASKGAESTVHSVKSVYSTLPKDQDQKLASIDRIKALIDDSEGLMDNQQKARVDSLRPYLDVRPLTLEDLPVDVTSSFTSKDGEILSFVAINASVALRDGRNAINFAREISTVHTESGETYYASSAHIIFAETLEIMLDDASKAVILTLLVVTLVLLIDLRSLLDTLLVMTPLLTALIWITGFMYIFDIRLNLYNMIAFPTVIGMGVDNGVHIFHRYRESGAGSLRLVLRTTGMALLATSLTTMVGFAGLVPAHHPALSSIGILSLIGLGCCFITSVTLLPALLQVREKK